MTDRIRLRPALLPAACALVVGLSAPGRAPAQVAGAAPMIVADAFQGFNEAAFDSYLETLSERQKDAQARASDARQKGEECSQKLGAIMKDWAARRDKLEQDLRREERAAILRGQVAGGGGPAEARRQRLQNEFAAKVRRACDEKRSAIEEWRAAHWAASRIQFQIDDAVAARARLQEEESALKAIAQGTERAER